MTRVLVTGASGHLGREVLRELKGRGHWVRALTRDPTKLAYLPTAADEVVVGDLTKADTLRGICDGIEFVISAAGLSVSASRQKDRAAFASVDYWGNRNLLDAAQKASVEKFIYVSVFGHDLFGHLEYVKAHEDFVQELQKSRLNHTVIRSTAYFSVFGQLYLPSLTVQRAIVLGDGTKRINPIHEADLAKVCIDAMLGHQTEIAVGGPKAHTRREIAELAFAAVGRERKLMTFPLWLASLLGMAMRPFDRRLSAMFAFGVAVSKVDCVAPRAGSRTLESYFQEVALRLKSLTLTPVSLSQRFG